jgi:hypothetical protein
MDDLLECLRPESRGRRFALEVGLAEHQPTSAQARVRIGSGTIGFQLATSFPDSRRVSKYRGSEGVIARSAWR